MSTMRHSYFSSNGVAQNESLSAGYGCAEALLVPGPLYLVTHVQQCANSEPERETLVVTDKVAHIFQQEVTWTVEVSKAQVRHHLQRATECMHTRCEQSAWCLHCNGTHTNMQDTIQAIMES